tara:strand:- start:83 stop:2317 length:2235 start_codon:yes stop_codon:yes gene_type:complete
MADINKTIQISYRAETANLVSGLTRVGKISESEARRIMTSLDKAYDKASKEAEKSAKKQVRALDTVQKKSKNLSTSMIRGFGEISGAMVAAGAAVLLFGQQIADLSNQLVDASTKTGVGVETLSGLRLAAEGAGLSFEELEMGLVRLPQMMDKAANGSKQAQRAFDRLGVSIVDTSQGFDELRSADDVLKDIFHSLQQVESAEKKAALASEIFGRQAGPKFIQSGALDNLEAFTTLATEFGVSTGPDMQKNMAEFQRISAATLTVVQGEMQRLLDTITGAEDGQGLNTAIIGAAKSFIFLGNVARDTLVGLQAAFGIVLAGSMGLVTVLTDTSPGGFISAMQSFEQMGEFIDSAAEPSENFVHMFSRASAEIEKFDAALQKTLSSPAQNRSRSSGANRATELSKQATIQQDLTDSSKLLSMIENKILEDEKRITKERRSHLDVQTLRNIQINEEIAALMEEQSLLNESVESSVQRLQAMEQTAETEQLINDLLENRDFRLSQIDQRLEQISDNLTSMTFQISDDDFEADMEKVDSFLEKQKEQQEGIQAITQALRDGAVDAAEETQMAWNRTFQDIHTGIGMLVTGLNVAGDLVDAYSQKNRHNAELVFNLRKAAAIAEVAMQTAINVTEVFPNPFLIAGAVALGAAQTAVIAAEQPQFHMGGIVGPSSGLAPDETFIRAKQGEAVLSSSVVNRLGEDGINALENGAMTQPVVIVTNPFKHYDRFIRGRTAMGMGTTSSGQIGY